MACFQTSFDAKASAFEENDLVYVHCVSKENFSVTLKGFTCVSLVCREIHVSVIERMEERRKALVPATIENSAIDELFAGVRSPVLIRISSSCDITCLDPSNLSGEGLARPLIWSCELIPAPAAQSVRTSVVKSSPLDEYFPPVELDDPCNCSSATNYCLISLIPEATTGDLLNLNDEESPQVSEDDGSESEADLHIIEEETDSDPEEVEYFTESFAVKGSFWAAKYQDALKKAMKNSLADVRVRASFESTNLKDKNAITFEVLDEGVWLVFGYCAVEKIPKLTKALRKEDVVAYKFCYIKRQWIPKISEFMLYAAVSITKKGQWDKNDSNNTYNSDLSYLLES